jgi:hypothetical protein
MDSCWFWSKLPIPVLSLRCSGGAASESSGTMTDPRRLLRVSFGGEDDLDLAIPIEEQGDARFLSTASDAPVTLPDGDTIAVYAEVGLGEDAAVVRIGAGE